MHEFYEIEEDIKNVKNKVESLKESIQFMNYEENESLFLPNETLLSKKKRLVEFIKDMNRLELLEIFEIFKKYNCSYTENSNGIFINITNVSEEVIDKVYHFIGYIKEKKKELNDHENLIKVEKDKIKDVNKLNEENYDNYIFNKNFINQIQENKNIEVLSDDEDEYQYVIEFSSEEEEEDKEEMENILSLKKKKVKYTGVKAKIMKSYKESGDGSKKKTTKEKEDENES